MVSSVWVYLVVVCKFYILVLVVSWLFSVSRMRCGVGCFSCGGLRLSHGSGLLSVWLEGVIVVK